MNIKEFKTKYKNNIKGLIFYYKELEEFLESKKNFNFFIKLRFKKIYELLNDKDFIYKNKDKPLFGVSFFVKNNFWISDEDISTEAGTKILKGFKPKMNSFVVKVLKESGAFLVGVTRMDELALGGTGLESEKPVINPIDSKRIVSGSSSGTAVVEYLLSLNKKFCSFSLGSDTGDSSRMPAVFLGIFGFKPSFGLISRRGLIPYSPSLDTVGILSSNLDNLIEVCSFIFKEDKFDFTSQKPPKFEEYKTFLNTKLNIGIFNDENLISEEMNEKFKEYISLLKKNKNFQIENVFIEKKIIDSLSIVYKMISYPEAISSQANLTGINFGDISNNEDNLYKTFEEQIIKNRTDSFLKEIKRRYTIGSFFTKFDENNESFYLKGQKIRRYINDYFKLMFNKYDFIITPASFGLATLKKDLSDFKKNPKKLKPTINDLLIISNFTCTPSIVIPIFKEKNKNYSINIMSKYKNDYKLLNFSKFLNNLINEGIKNET